jgi:1-deoxy-D-xylulose-5-phosphate synthase
MGLYDIAYMLAVPEMVVTAPKDATEMLGILRTAVARAKGPTSIRYPRDAAPDIPPALAEIAPVPEATWEVLRQGGDFVILAVGTMVLPSLVAAEELAAEGIDLSVVNCRYLKPYDEVTLNAVLAHHKHVLVVEEGAVVNGFGAYMAHVIDKLDPSVRVAVHGVPDRFIDQAPRKRQLEILGLDAPGIARRVRALLDSEALTG